MHATIIMEGRLVTDPEIKSGKNGDYCTFRFVVNTKYGNQDNASFFNCTASEYIANRMQKAGIKKGRLIEIIGNLNLRPYETDEGIRQISADVSVLEGTLLVQSRKAMRGLFAGYDKNRTEEHR